MKAKVNVALVQFAPRWLEAEYNAGRMMKLAEEQAQQGAELIVFPELANVGYITPQIIGEEPSFGPGVSALEFASKYYEASDHIPGITTELLGQVAKKYGVYIVVGISQKHPAVPGNLYNSAALIGPAGLIGVHHKMHIPLNEKYYFYSGETADVYATELGNIAMMICYDLRFPELTRIYALKGAEIVCVPWAGAWVGKYTDPDHLTHRAFTRAQENANYLLLCNRTGPEGKNQFIGRSLVAAPNGGIIASTDSDEETAVCAELNNEEILKARALFTIYEDRRPDLYSLLVEPIGLAPSSSRTLEVGVLRDPSTKMPGDSRKN